MNTTLFIWANRIRHTLLTILAIVGLNVLFLECPWQSIPIAAVLMWAITLLIRFTVPGADRTAPKYLFRVIPVPAVLCVLWLTIGLLCATALCGRYQMISGRNRAEYYYVVRLDKLTGEISFHSFPLQ